MTDLFDACIIGSGPAGISAASALLSEGKRVLMLDVGKHLSEELVALKERLASTPKNNWRLKDYDKIKDGTAVTTKGVSEKRIFSSLYPYETPPMFPKIVFENSGLLPSFAEGGFSSVWGCSCLPYRNSDLIDWPLSDVNLKLHYEKVMKFTKVFAEEDDLNKEFSLHTDHPIRSPSSGQTNYVLNILKSNRGSLLKKGIRFGKSRILLNRTVQNEKNCIVCGLCLYGCPKNILFNAGELLKDLKKSNLFSYHGGTFVHYFNEKDDHVDITCEDTSDNKRKKYCASRLFVGAGVIPTAVLIMRSQKNIPNTLTLKDSQYFLQPVFIPGFRGNVLKEELATFAQLFIEIENKNINDKNIHLQFYGYSDMIKNAVQSKIPFSIELIPDFLLRVILGRLAVIQGYLDSSVSQSLTLQFDAESNVVSLRGLNNPITPLTIHKTMSFMRKIFFKTGLFPIPGMLQITVPGRGFHVGSSFPMSLAPKANETDLLGRLNESRLVHIIDASIFPTIPSTTITLTVMANAHRIAYETTKL